MQFEFCRLQISDLFVLPRLQEHSLANILDGKPSTIAIESKKFFDFIKERKKVVLYGETLQGKTITSRYLFLRLRSKGIIPVLLDGENFNEKNIKQTIKNAFDEQYSSNAAEAFTALNKSERALIIDNFGANGLIQSQLQQVLNKLCEDFDYVIAVAHINLRLQQFIQNENQEIRFSDYTHCEIKPFNSSQRKDLIQKWVKLANASKSEDVLLREINQHEQIVETACDSGLLVPYPAYILGVLTVNESAKQNVDESKYGTVGYLYESLITAQFAKLEEEIDLQQIYILLGEMAYNAFKNERLDISFEETQQIINSYQSEYLQNIYIERFIRQILKAGVVLEQNKRFRFSSVQLRDFFVANYYTRAINDKERSAKAYEEIDYIIKRVTYESHTRILLFLVYKANDKPHFIEQILNVSRIIFSNFLPTDLKEDVAFLNELKDTNIPTPKLIESNSVWERREKLSSKNA